MPPKPKGLKASKRAAPVDPATLANDTSDNKAVDLNQAKTAPLDDDALTLADLFELRTSVLEILYPFPTSLTLDDADPDRLDEARSFLRGILHGCAALEPLVTKFDEAKDGGPDSERDKRAADLGADKLDALGVSDALAEGHLLFLQGFALHYLGELFEPPEHVVGAASAAVRNAAGSKRRKIDVREPQTRVEWIAAAYQRLDRLVDGVITQSHSTTSGDGADADALVALARGQYWLAVARYIDELSGAEGAGRDDDDEQLAELVEDDWAKLWSSLESVGGYQPERAEGQYHDFDDSFFAVSRAAAARIALVEGNVGGDREASLEELDTAVQALERYKGHALGAEDHARHAFVVDVVIADAKASKFLLLEDAVEAKFRPDADDAAEDDEDDDAEVTPLPLDAEEVVTAKSASEEAISALRSTLDAYAKLAKDVAHPSAKAAQYRKLEEVLLVSSALVNPDEKDKAAAVEAEIEQVRKDGGMGAEAGEGTGEEADK
ncbi:uncharacterized protein RHOBADRAFT_54684 [Rhodotorula graminis WP1]|uniref:Enhancer of translation termination 1 n=1 Tax=Rhodotorula graminis (strain WP1) TaxID=578459 RepID=A0A0P9EN96_RHOGW|nr:uncharacterized protein RHOBADRAFT_54684 [Rhodotorula graminis WP1]KPV73460.1 hypothetical protein RHOBADRAFT_54684 [Rhodotorula graminis WP1]